MTPRRAVNRVWTWATVLALAVLVAQVGQLADVPGPLLLCATLWMVVAWLTRRRGKRRAGNGNGGFLWGALFGASVESIVRRS